jgi:alkanesulfonate monooxygenase SsuD/methylene tetrahydromethanopterin reductase-like flavin-dependent oxidoreductase (luciferase family)
MPSQVPLSILDLSPVSSGQTAADALRNTLDLARHAERLGYRRFWLAEHHLAPGIASAAPPVLAALVAAATNTIRVGSGASLLGNHTPLTVVEQFGTIAQVHPNRIDLGLGRSGLGRINELAQRSEKAAQRQAAEPKTAATKVVDGLPIPGPPRARMSANRLKRLQTHASLLGATEQSEYVEQVRQVLDFREGRYRDPEGIELHSPPAEGADLQVLVFGSSAGPSARTAGEFGLPYAANYHVSPSTILESVAAYRDAFTPSKYLARPYVVVSADVVVADDDETARTLASPYAEWVLSIRAGDGAIPFPSPAAAAEFPWTEELRSLVVDRVETQIVGSPETVVGRLETLSDVTQADELLITTITHQHTDRVRSYELLSHAWTGTGSG